MLAYLTSYLCKAEHGMSELMKKASKEAGSEPVRQRLRKVGDIFLKNRELSTHECIVRVLSLPMRTSNIGVIFIPTGLKEQRTRMLKPAGILDTMDPDDPNIYCTNFLERYANRPNELENLCYADFATNYKPISEEKDIEVDDLENYTSTVTPIECPEIPEEEKPIVLKNKLGKMRKRTFPCIMRYHKGSKLKDPEHYYMTLLQLYYPWRDEDNLKDGCLSYQERFEEIEHLIKSNIKNHDCFYGVYDDDEDMIGHIYQSSDEENETYAEEFEMFNPNLLDLDPEEGSGVVSRSVPSSVVENISLPRETFYENCSQLNEGQQHIFDFIKKYAHMLMLNSRNDVPDPDPFFIFLTGGAGVGKSFVMNCITEYLRKTLKYPGQDFHKQPSVKVTASTGKAATNVNGITLHSAFKLPVHQGGTKRMTKPSKQSLPMLQEQYRYLKVLLIDEISMTEKETFNDLNVWLRLIMKRDDLDFGGVSLLLVGDFYQLPPGNNHYIIRNMSPTDAWYNFEMKELTEIVCESSDPSFAELLNNKFINSLEHNDESDSDHIRLYI